MGDTVPWLQRTSIYGRRPGCAPVTARKGTGTQRGGRMTQWERHIRGWLTAAGIAVGGLVWIAWYVWAS